VKRIWPAVTGIVLVLVVFYIADCLFQTNERLRKAEADYAELVRVTEADHAIQQGIISEAEARIDEQSAVIAQTTAEVETKDAEIAALKRRLAEEQAAEPPTTAYIEALPVVRSLRAQVSTLSELLALSEAKSAAKDRIIVSKDTIISAQADQIAAWRIQYENEHALRIGAETLIEEFRLARRGAKAWRTAAIVAGAVAAGLIITK